MLPRAKGSSWFLPFGSRKQHVRKIVSEEGWHKKRAATIRNRASDERSRDLDWTASSAGINVLLAISAIALPHPTAAFQAHGPNFAFTHSSRFVATTPHAGSPTLSRSCAGTFTPFRRALAAPPQKRPGYPYANGFRGARCLSSESSSLSMQSPAPHLQSLNTFNPESEEWRICQELLVRLQGDLMQNDKVSSLSQGSKEWLEARKYRLTGSNFGAAVGNNRFTSPDELVSEMLNPKFTGNDATRHGNKHEPQARETYIAMKKQELARQLGVQMLNDGDFTVTESGLHIWRELPFLAVSPDGHVRERGMQGLLEIKCPYNPDSKLMLDEIPPYYNDQMQGLMAILGYSWADFFVWQPDNRYSTRRVSFDAKYWEESLLPRLTSFYSNRFLPAYINHELQRRRQAPSNPGMPKTMPMPSGPASPTSGMPKAMPTPSGPASPTSSGPSAEAPRTDLVAKPRPVISVVSIAPLPGIDGQDSGISFMQNEKGGQPVAAMNLLGEPLGIVRELDLALSAKGLRPEYVGSSPDSFFFGLARQLGRLGLLDKNFDMSRLTVDGVPMQMPRAASKAKDLVMKHIGRNYQAFEKVRIRHDMFEWFGLILELNCTMAL
jgi:putative phage-type endonuclease